MKKIGIIGGAGVAATNKLNELLEIRLTKKGAFRDCHHPEIIIYQATKVPSRSMYLEGRGQTFVDDYVNIAKKLKSIGAERVCMCCNTAHYAIDEIKRKSGAIFIDLVSDIVMKAKNIGKRKIGLIASDGCLKGKVYEKYFCKIFPTAELIYPDENIQKEVTKGICNIKNSSRFLPKNHPDRPFTIFSKVLEHLKEKGAEIIIVGCTDIRVDFKADMTIDSLDVLVSSIIGESMNEQ
jgi:aspartate racemase